MAALPLTPPGPEGVKKFRRVGGPGLQHGDKPFGIIVGRVHSRGVFQFFHTFSLPLGQGWRLKKSPQGRVSVRPN